MTTNPDSRNRMKITPTHANGTMNTLDEIVLINFEKLFADVPWIFEVLISSSSVSREA